MPKATLNLSKLSDDELLDMRFCDLNLRLVDSALQKNVDELHRELSARGLKFRPHCWLSDDWYSPDGIPGIAIPFYLAHPRLMRLERRMLLEVEGGTKVSCMKILRHEAGHAIDTAYRLRRRSAYRRLFGSATAPYRDTYEPIPTSQDYVLHLEMWYAQAHPLEDFAETFAVWLRPGSRWRTQYRQWPALRKLNQVDEWMRSIRGTAPVVRSRKCVEPLTRIRKTLREHYTAKRDHYGLNHPNVADADLRRLFTGDVNQKRLPTAAAFLSRIRAELRRVVARWTGQYSYTIDQVIQEMIERCRELRLRVAGGVDDVKRDAMILVAVRTTSFMHQGRQRVAI
ncbi:MAG: putative zinc-binding metallopeptidase [Planctomycetota bacterium]